jgi:hypothetical protein
MKNIRRCIKLQNVFLRFLIYKSIFIVLILLGTIFLFSNCEGECPRRGIIYDIDTRNFIDSVKCEIITNPSHPSRTTYTDSKGEYFFIVKFGGFQTDCPDIVVKFSKEGYKTKDVKNLKQEDIIYLEKD